MTDRKRATELADEIENAISGDYEIFDLADTYADRVDAETIIAALRAYAAPVADGPSGTLMEIASKAALTACRDHYKFITGEDALTDGGGFVPVAIDAALRAIHAAGYASVPRNLLAEAHAVMRACGWHLAPASESTGDGVLELAAAEIEEKIGNFLAETF